MPKPYYAGLPLGGAIIKTQAIGSPVTWAGWSPGRENWHLAAASRDGIIRVWWLDHQGRISGPNSYRGHRQAVQVAAWSPDGEQIASAGDDTTVQIWTAITGRHVFTYRGHTALIYGLAWSPDGRHIASAGGGPEVQVWEAATGRRLFTYRRHRGVVRALAWSPNGQQIASVGEDRQIEVFDASTGQSRWSRIGHAEQILCVAWSHDGRRIATGSRDRAVAIWDAATGSPLSTYLGHAGAVNAVAWFHDGTSIASGGADGVHLWRAPDHPLLIRKLQEPQGEVQALSYSPPDGWCLVAGSAGSADGALYLYLPAQEFLLPQPTAAGGLEWTRRW